MEVQAQSIQLIGAYRSIYTRLVRPDVTVPVRHYFLTRWAPRLGGDLTLLVIQLRRLCLAKGGEPVALSAEQLARLVGISERTLRRLLADERLKPFVERQHQWRYDPSVGHGVQGHNRYIVALDDPLTEEDEQLASDLAQDTERALRSDEILGPPANVATAAPVDERPAPPPARRPSYAGAAAAGRSGRLRGLAGQTGHHTSSAPLRGQAGSSEPVKLADTIRRIGFDPESIASDMEAYRGSRHHRPSPVDLLAQRPDWQERIEQAEHVLNETGASRGFYIKVLRALEKHDALGIWDRALGLAREQDPSTIRRSKGALFNVLVRRFAAESGVTI